MNNAIYAFLSGNDRNISRNNMLWNMIASTLYSFQSALLLLIVTRAGGLAAAGIFSITYSISQMFASIGSFSMREYQVSDIRNDNSFHCYLTSRCFTNLVMVLMCVGYSILQGHSGEKLAVIAVLSLYRMVDGFDDVFHGELQKRGRLDIASRIFAIRIALASVLYAAAYLITGNLLISAMVLTGSAVFVSGTLDILVAGKQEIRGRIALKGMWKLLASCLPICGGAFLYNYLVNSPKYAIDGLLSEQMQGAFNILYMPLFVISMMSTFVFKPYVSNLGKLWTENDRKGFTRLCLILTSVILGLSACVVIGGALLGMPLLNLVFGVHLNEYHSLFVLLLSFGSLSALNAFFTVVITVMRRQAYILAAYCTATVVDVLFMNQLVREKGLTGAGLVYGMVMGIICLFYLIVIIQELRKMQVRYSS